MGLYFLVASILPAVLWGLAPIISKRAMANQGNYLQACLTLVTVSSLVYWGTLYFQKDSGMIINNLTPEAVFIFVAGGVIGTSIGRLFTFRGIELVGASLTSAAVSTRPFYTGILAIFLLSEPFTSWTITGIVLMVLGLIILALSKGGDLQGWKRRDLLFPLIGALAFGVGGVIRRYGFTRTGIPVLEAVALNELGALVTLGTYIVLTDPKKLINVSKKSYGLFTVQALFTAVALFSMFYALSIGPVIIVDPLTSTAPLFTTFFSYYLLRDLERITPGIVIGSVLVVIGAALVTIG